MLREPAYVKYSSVMRGSKSFSSMVTPASASPTDFGIFSQKCPEHRIGVAFGENHADHRQVLVRSLVNQVTLRSAARPHFHMAHPPTTPFAGLSSLIRAAYDHIKSWLEVA